MKDLTHTPGPWAIEPARETKNALAINSDEWDELATVYFHEDFEETPGKANAKLIAAAPDLLEALIEVVAVADRQTVEFDKAKAAIKKATE